MRRKNLAFSFLKGFAAGALLIHVGTRLLPMVA
jgi:hypothetical protein